MTPAALAICVNYHGARDTATFVGDVLAGAGPVALRIVVVDNGEAPGSPDLLASLAAGDARVALLRPARNLGYAPAAAAGLRAALEGSPLPDWVVVSNNDVRVPADFFARLVQLYPSGGGVVAPAIWCERTRADQNPYLVKRPSRLRMRFQKAVTGTYATYAAYELLSLAKGRLRSVLRAPSPRGPAPLERPVARPIYAPHGAFMVFHRSYFEAGGTLDAGLPFYNEEFHVAETARRLGLAVVYEPRLAVVHRGHTTLRPFSRRVARAVRAANAFAAETYFRGGEAS